MARGNRTQDEIGKSSAFHRRIVLSLSLLAGGYLVFSLLLGDMGVVKHWTMIQVAQNLEVEREMITRENHRLRHEIESLRSDPVTIERTARERLGMIRPGEIIYRFYERSK